ncbi:hypothetical protein [Raoultella scottii]|uniref:hypothetical protein n=1 Tax=Raoultella scottii TaxID=3040937 RepID=UPI003F69E006
MAELPTPTQKAVPSDDIRDHIYAGGMLDKVVTSTELTYTDRLGGVHYTVDGMKAEGDAVVEETRLNLIPLGKQYMTLTAAQADIANIPDGSTTYVRNATGSSLADEYINNGGTLTATGRKMPAMSNIGQVQTLVGNYASSDPVADLISASVNNGSSLSQLTGIVFSERVNQVSAAGTLTIRELTLLRLDSFANASSSASTLNFAGGAVASLMLLPGESVAAETKTTPFIPRHLASFSDFSVRIDTDVVRFIAIFPDVDFIISQTAQRNVFDKTGTFTASTQVPETWNGRYISTHTDGGIQLIIPKTEVTAAGYDISYQGVHDYVVATYLDRTFFVKTAQSHKEPAQGLFLTGSDVTLSLTGTGTFQVSAYAQTISAFDPGDTTPVKYSADVQNNISTSLSAIPSSISVEFAPGECPNPSCIEVTDGDGNAVSAQWLPEPNVNYSTGERYGYHSDGSLRCGTLIFERNYTSGEVAHFIINVYQNRRFRAVRPLLVATTDGYALSFGGRTYLFGSANGYQLSSVTENSVALMTKYSAYCAFGLSNDVPMSQWGGSVQVTEYGDVFVEVTTTLKNQYVEAVVKTRMMASGKVFIDTVFTAITDIPVNSVYGLTGRLEFDSVVTDKAIDLDRTTTFWSNSGVKRSANLLYCHGDIHRDGTQYAPTLPAWSTIVDLNSTSAGHVRMYGGWAYRSASYPVVALEEGRSFAHGYYIDLNQQRANLFSANNAAHNLPYGLAGSGVIERAARRQLYRDLMDYVDAQSAWWDANGTNAKTVAYCAHLAIRKLLGEGDSFETIYANFLQYCVTYHGGITNLGQSYFDNILVLQFASRTILPNIQWFYREAVANGDTAKQAQLKAGIVSLADALVQTFNEKGFVPLQYSFTAAPPSNANTTAIRCLAIAIALTGDATGKYLAALQGLETYINQYLKTENIFTENIASILGQAHYLHYADYAYHDYLRACDLLERTPILNMSTYMLQATAAYGALREQIYCISNSRKGSSLTYAYQIYALDKQMGLSGQNACRALLGHLKEQINPDGSMPRPMDNWPPNLNTTAASPLPFEIQALAEILLEKYYG